MKQRRMTFAFIMFIVGWMAIRPATVVYATDHTGTCTGTFTEADNPHRLTGSCTVPASGLTIEPGVTLNGQGFSLAVQGTLTADGAVGQEILLTNVAVSFSQGSAGSITRTTWSGSFSNLNMTDASPTINNNMLSGWGGSITITGGSGAVAPTISNNTIGSTSSGTIIVNGNSLTTPTISNNQITFSSGSGAGILVTGGQPMITDNTLTATSGGIGISYNTTGAGSATGNIINFQGNGVVGIQVSGDASPQLNNNRINDNPTVANTGIALDITPASAVQVVNNEICATGTDIPLRVSPGFFANTALAQVSGTNLSCGVAAGIGLQGALTSGSATLRAVEGQTTFRVTSSLTVDAGTQLTIPAGFSLNSQGQPWSVAGTLIADGAVGQEIAFTNISMAFSQGSAGSITRTTWSGPFSGIDITSASPTISNNTLSGSNPISISDVASPTISNNTIAGASMFEGIVVNGNSLTTPNISNNQITASRGIRIAGGQPAITGNTLTVGQTGLDYAATTAGSATGNTINFAVGGGGVRVGIQVSSDASPQLRNNRITDDPTAADTGIVLDVTPVSTVQVVDNEICATGTDTPLHLSPGFFAGAAQESGTVLSCGLGAGLRLIGSLTTGSATLRALVGQTSFRISSSPIINSGAQLTIPAGMSFRPLGSLGSLVILGRLDTTGSSFTNVTLDFHTGSSGSVTNNTFVGASFATGLLLTGASPAVTGNTFTGIQTAVALSGVTNVTLENNTFRSNTTAVQVTGGNARSTLSQNLFEQNTRAVSFADGDALFSAFPAQLTTNTCAGATNQNTLELPSSISTSGTLLAVPTLYSFNAIGSTVASGTTVTIQPGTIIQSAGGALTVNGDLVARGRADLPITFTSDTPKNVSGGALVINNKTAPSTTVLDSVIVEFVASGFGAVQLSNADITIANSVIMSSTRGMTLTNGSDALITHSAIVQNLGVGVTVTNSNPTITHNSIFNNAGNGVTNTTCPTPGSMITAQSNYWGHDSGPLDAADDTAGGGLFNPSGLGEEVSNCVGYDPWIRIGPSIEGTITAIGGGGQTGMVGTVLPQPLVVEVQSTLGSLLEDIAVTFSVVEGDASIVEEQSVPTDQNGRASAHVRLGTTAGPVTVAVTARDVNSPLAIFAANGTAGGGLMGFALTAVPLELVVKPGKKGQLGDVNNDGKVNNTDAAMILAVLDGVLTPDIPPALNYSRSGDINRDGFVDDGDVYAIQGYVAKTIVSRRR